MEAQMTRGWAVLALVLAGLLGIADVRAEPTTV
jgi:hypothetical protein